MSSSATDPSEVDAEERSRKRKRRWVVLGASLVATLAVAASFLIGRITAPDDTDTAASSCTQIDSDLRRMKDEAAAAGEGSSEAANIVRTQLNMIVQNPDCFTADVRGQAQTALDRDDQRVGAEAECAASGEPWWKC